MCVFHLKVDSSVSLLSIVSSGFESQNKQVNEVGFSILFNCC